MKAVLKKVMGIVIISGCTFTSQALDYGCYIEGHNLLSFKYSNDLFIANYISGSVTVVNNPSVCSIMVSANAKTVQSDKDAYEDFLGYWIQNPPYVSNADITRFGTADFVLSGKLSDGTNEYPIVLTHFTSSYNGYWVLAGEEEIDKNGNLKMWTVNYDGYGSIATPDSAYEISATNVENDMFIIAPLSSSTKRNVR